MRNNKIEIDLVYLWVDGDDPQWLEKHNAFIGNVDEKSSINCKGRYIDNDELKFSLRSIEKYAPWIRKIFIVTDNQTPEWLDTTHSKVKIIDHKEILPSESLPCFNSVLLEHFLHRIPGLSEHFIFANDDMLINKPVSPEMFFTDEGLPIIRLKRKPFRRVRWFWRKRIRKKPLLNYSKKIKNASEFVEKKYGTYFLAMPHHNMDAYLRSDCQRIAEQVLKDKIEAMILNRKRNNSDIQRVVYSYIALVERRGKLHYSSPKYALHIQIHQDKHYSKFEKFNPTLFCMNDSEYANDDDRMKSKAFLEKLFPEKSEFEK
ncbi:MAG: stealth family protein [Mangrovibacterium sp.]